MISANQKPMTIDHNLNILVIEVDPGFSADLEKRLTDLGFKFCCTVNPDSRIDQLDALSPDLAILGPSLRAEALLKCVQKLKIINLGLPILTCCDANGFSGDPQGTPFEGIHHLGPKFAPDHLLGVVETALNLKAECELRPEFQILIGQSQRIREIRQKITSVSDKDITVLITGETGTGKELIARSIHYHSHRNQGPLVKINCGSLPDELLESEVFGFQKGAFTDAHKNKPGRIELAHGGTLFIDEIGNLSLNLQVKFLQVLEDKTFSRLGATRDMNIDTRVVAATNSDLSKKVREGSFRKDLFYRLHVVHIKAPSLRERKDDIPLLIHYFMNKYCFEFKREPLDVPDNISKIFQDYPWPGNVRELENVIRRAIVLRDWNFIFNELNLDHEITNTTDLPVPGLRPSPFYRSDEDMKRLFTENDYSLKKITKAYVSEAERTAILRTLGETQWNRRKAAKLLHVSYKTLLNRIEEFGLEPEKAG